MSSWPHLIYELDKWRDAGLPATFWLRDDDADTTCAELDRLLHVMGRRPLALSVIPARVDDGLAERLREAPSVSVWQHGWTHRNWWGSEQASEYPSTRNPLEVKAEIALGKAILERMFGAQAKAVFVPPWSGLADEYIPLLRKLRFAGLSRISPRSKRKAKGVPIVNAHVELIEWTMTPLFSDDDVYLDQILKHLEGRRTARFDVSEPTGLIWHHKCQDDRSYEFLRKIINVVDDHPAARWVDPIESFRPPRIRGVANIIRPALRKAA